MKIYNGNEILFHWIFRGFRADTDLSVQQQFTDEFFIRDVCKGRVRLSIVVPLFQVGQSRSSRSSVVAKRIVLVHKAPWSQETLPGRDLSSEFAIGLHQMRSATMLIGWSFAIAMRTTGST